MKRKNIGLVITTLVVIAMGSATLGHSVMQVKGAVQKELSGSTEMRMEDEVSDEPEYTSKEDSSLIHFNGDFSNNVSSNTSNEVACVSGVYKGQSISITDGLTDKETAWINATQIMDYIYEYVDKNILVPCEINKTEYEYNIQRQYHKQNGTNYGVFLQKNGRIICTIGICLKDEPALTSFARDGLIDLYGGEHAIPKEYLIKNWCKTYEQREHIYAEYLDSSKEIIEDMLGLPSINETLKDVNCVEYFEADDNWSTVTFGYILENGLYVKVFYNRVNQMWDGFAIEGYHKDYYDIEQ